MPFIEDFREFCIRMGCEHVSVNQRHLFENGGQSDGVYDHRDPPDDKWSLLRLKREYLTACLANDMTDWRKFKDHCTEQLQLKLSYPAAVPSLSMNAVEQLKRGKANIQKLKDELFEVAEKLSHSPEEIAKAKNNQILTDTHEQTQSLFADIMQIEL